MQFAISLLLIASVPLLLSCESKLKVSSSGSRSGGGVKDCTNEAYAASNPTDCAEIPPDKDKEGTTPSKFQIANCLNPNLSKVLDTETITLCDGTEAKGQLTISGSVIKAGESVAGIAGSFSGAYSNCSSEGDQSCIVTGSFKAADTTSLAAKVISTASVAGVTGNVTLPTASEVQNGVNFGAGGTALTGTKMATKQCRNAADLATWDTSGLSNLGSGNNTASLNQATAGNVDTGTEELNFNPTTWGLTTGFPVQFTSTGTLPGGLSAGTTYYVIPSGTKIKLAASAANAIAGTPLINLTAANTGTLRMPVAPDSVADLWDTIDDYNNNLATAPDLTPGWAASYVCDNSNFTNVSSSGDPDLTPPNNTPAGATAAFSQIWRDDLTGLHFSNILYDGSGSVSWAGGMAMCAGLNSGDGAGNWRMPTQKELMQLYIDGISKVTVAGGNWATSGSGYMWSSSAVSIGTDYVWIASLAYGDSSLTNRFGTSNGVFCVR